jgi:hypothetical protein
MLPYAIIVTNRKLTLRTVDNYLLSIQRIDKNKHASIQKSVFTVTSYCWDLE